MSRRWFWLLIGAAVALGFILRMRGVHSPLLDHPGWRQGDTAAIARNFATLDLNPLHPQTDYNGPPPNYVELELQIVPWLAALAYKVIGVHEVIGRLIGIAFGTATIALVGLFAAWLFESTIAGAAAAAIYAVLPGPLYYSHTFMPDTTMVFFTVAALFAAARWLIDGAGGRRGFATAAVLMAIAFLAKPVAVTAIVPVAALALARHRAAIFRNPLAYAYLAIAFVPLLVYDRIVSAQAEWHWASGITRLHVLPSLRAALVSGGAFVQKAKDFAHALIMLGTTMAGPAGVALILAGLARARSKADPLLWGWLGGGLLYAYVVVTVERVDYYLYLLVPLAALYGGALVAHAWPPLVERAKAKVSRPEALAAFAFLALLGAMTVWDLRLIAPYYGWSRANYARAKQLDAQLPPGILIVIGHYDPSILYYINRKGWEEDPHLWTPFDEQSAIRKGARAFVSVEHKRLRTTNLELYCWLARFPVDEGQPWPVYTTDPALVAPGAEDRWHAFRRREMAGEFHDWRAQAATSPSPCGAAAVTH